MNKIILCVAVLSLSACAGNNGVGNGDKLTKKSANTNCRMVKALGSKIPKKVCSGGTRTSTKSD
jgi:hypothetical protein